MNKIDDNNDQTLSYGRNEDSVTQQRLDKRLLMSFISMGFQQKLKFQVKGEETPKIHYIREFLNNLDYLNIVKWMTLEM